MAYATGNAANLPDVLTALRNFCTTNGWALSGNVLHKDGGAYTSILHVVKGAFLDFGFLEITGGTGIDGGNLLTTPSGSRGYLGPLMGASDVATVDWDWPVTYYLFAHEDPNEVYMFINYGSGQFWQNLCFGQSPSPGCPGTGNWFHGFTPAGGSQMPPVTNPRLRRVAQVVANPQGSVLSTFNSGMICPAPFFWESCDESNGHWLSDQFHGCFNDVGATVWSSVRFVFDNTTAGDQSSRVSSSKALRPLLEQSPNTWNNEAHLIRCIICQVRLENKTTVLGELQHMRFIRNDFLDDGEVITLGPDQWKVFPMYRKDVTQRNGVTQTGTTHSGTLAMAIRYDGV